jgi:ribosomal protein S18 acetylase RimI-like enzyme
VPRYRLLRREELIGVLSGEPSAPAAAPPAVRIEEASAVSGELVDRIGGLVRQLSSSSREPNAGELQQIIENDATTLLVAKEADGTVVGSLTLVLFRIPTGVRAWVEDVVVDERARGRGVGEALTKEALRRAAEKGARTVDLTSRPAREAANRMYGRIGFRRRETHVYRLET